MTERAGQLHLGVAIGGAGMHPAAWRVPGAACDAPSGVSAPGHGAGSVAAVGALTPVNPLGVVDAVGAALLRPETYLQRARTAEAGLLDFVMLDDALVPGGEGPVALQARLDALLTLARVAPGTSRVGLVATVSTTHTEPFNVGKNVATLDWVSLGRAGWRPTVATEDSEYAHFGRRSVLPQAQRWAEAADVLDVVSRMADSWEDDAIIRDASTGRYIERDKVHSIDFVGPYFKVRGPSITPRSPQAQPLVVMDAGPDAAPDDIAARWADVILIDAATPTQARDRCQRLRDAVRGAGRQRDQVFVLARVEILLAETQDVALSELALLDEVEAWPIQQSRFRFVGAAPSLATNLAEWAQAAGLDGFVVLPARLPLDLDRFAAGVPPKLARAGVFRTAYDRSTLRHHFGLPRPFNRYAVREPHS